MKRLFSLLLIVILTCLLAACGLDSTPDTTDNPISTLSPEEVVRAAVEESDLKSWCTSSNVEPYAPISILRDYTQFPALHAFLTRDDLDTFFVDTAAPILREYLEDDARAENPDHWKNALAIADMVRILCPHITDEVDRLTGPVDLLADIPTEDLIEIVIRDTLLHDYLKGGKFTYYSLSQFSKECPELSSIWARAYGLYPLCSHIEMNQQQLREELGDAQTDALLEIVWLAAPHNLCYSMDNETLLRTTFERNYLENYYVSELEGHGSLLFFADYANNCPPLYELLMRNDGMAFMKEYIPILVDEYKTSGDGMLIQAAMKLEFIYEILFP